jgi:hypothetical protein
MVVIRNGLSYWPQFWYCFGTEMKDKNVYEILFQLNKIYCHLTAFTVGRLKRGWSTLKMEATNSCWTYFINIAKQHGVISRKTYRYWRAYLPHVRGQTHSCNWESVYLINAVIVHSQPQFIEDLVHSVRRSLCTQCFTVQLLGVVDRLMINILLLVRHHRLSLCRTVPFCDRRLVTPKFRPMNMQNAHNCNGDLQCKLSLGELRYTVVDITVEHKEIRCGLDTLG